MVMPRSLNCVRMPLWLDSSMQKPSGARWNEMVSVAGGAAVR
jgi:hypothetical protein